jgi:hypothetical protein
VTLAQNPAWWTRRNVLDDSAGTNDFAPAVQGQLKWIASMACEELQTNLWDGAGSNVQQMVDGFPNSNNLAPLNIGQLKNTAKPFYDRLFELGLTNDYPTDVTNRYPWTSTPADDDDYAPVTVGQLKYVFSFDLDVDGDGMANWWEDGYGLDSTTNDASEDADSDGLSNLSEFYEHTDPTASDTDSDGLSDGVEVNTEGTDPLDSDSDDDRLTDGVEVNTENTDPLDSDSDDDGLNDGTEVNTEETDPLDADSDDDGLNDGTEVNTEGTDPLDSDSDDDGLNDGTEVNTEGTDPLDPDSDDDGLNDGVEVNTENTDPLDSDSDDDGMPDGWEVNHNCNPLQDDASSDPDNDDLSNLDEYTNGTEPDDDDTDSDGMQDGWEVDYALNPLQDDARNDADLDGFTNLEEHEGQPQTDPTDPTSIPGSAVYVSTNATPYANGSWTLPYGSIHRGVAHSVNGDRVVVLPGTYTGPTNRNISFGGRAITVQGAGGPTGVIVDCENTNRAFRFIEGETSNSILRGFTIQNGAADIGAGVYCRTSSPSIERCMFIDNTAVTNGGGIGIIGGSPRIEHCAFLRNVAELDGGAISSEPLYIYDAGIGSCICYGPAPFIEECDFTANVAREGGGIYLREYYRQYFTNWFLPENHHLGTSFVVRSTFNMNTSSVGTVHVENHAYVLVENCLIARNMGCGLYSHMGHVKLRSSTIVGNTHTNTYGSGVLGVPNPSASSDPDYMDVDNCVIWTNSPRESQVGILSDVYTYTMNYTCYDPCENTNYVNYFTFGAGLVTNNPSLTRNGRLLSTSVCRNAGNTATAAQKDIDNESRPCETDADMGFDEFVDSDSDTLPDVWEQRHGLSALVYTDPQANPDGDELTSALEYLLGTSPTATPVDSDDDGLTDDGEVYCGTDPADADTDDDYFPDGWEYTYGYDPADGGDIARFADDDDDGVNNLEEMNCGLDPNDDDTDNDGITDGQDADTCAKGVSFKLASDNGEIYLADTQAGSSPVYAHLNHLIETNEAGALVGLRGEEYPTDDEHYESGTDTYTTIWRSDERIISLYIDTCGDGTNYSGSLQLYRGVITNAVLVDSDGGSTTNQLTTNSAFAISWSGYADDEGGGGWVRLDVMWDILSVDIVSVDATDDIGPTKINYRINPSGVSIPSMTFTAPGITETRADVSGDFYFTYNQSDLPYGESQITLEYLGCEAVLTVNKEGVGTGQTEEIIIATIPVDPGWVHWPISHRLSEGYARITYSGAPVLPDSYTLHVGGSHVTLEADETVTIDWAHEKHRYHDDDGTYNEQAMTLYTGGPTLPPTTAYRKFYDSTDDRFFIPGKNLEGIAQMESVSLDGILPLNLANENIDQELE